jgi:ankyrin repeat protein
MAQSFGDKLAGAAWTRNLTLLKELIPVTHRAHYDYTVLTLEKQGDVNMPNSRGQTALYCACRQNYPDIVCELLNAPSINVNVQVVEHGGTPLHGTCAQTRKRWCA